MQELAAIELGNLLIGFIPVILVLGVMWRWRVQARDGLVANLRMLVQLLLVGYVLTFVFESNRPLLIAGIVVLMIGVSSWIALRPLEDRGVRSYLVSSAAIGVVGTLVLVLVTQAVLDMPRWFEPRVVVPLAGMIFANAMNAVSLAAERLQAETKHNRDLIECRHAAMDAAVIPQINALLAVGLVSLPGMMTGQILSGVDPLVAVRYQIMVMCMIFGASGLSAAVYLYWMVRWKVAVH